MRHKLWISLLALLLLAACTQGGTAEIPASTLAPTPTLGAVTVNTTSVPDTRSAAKAYLGAWEAEDYSSMYGMLTQISHDAISLEDFTRRYRDVAAEAALSGWDTEILSALTNPRTAQVSYRVILHSALVGDLTREIVMNLSLENGQWKVQWDDALILPELSGGNYLRMEYRTPSRANIYDREGHALVAQTDAVALGLDTSQVDPEQEDSLLQKLYQLTGIRPEVLQPQIENYRDFGWYLPIADVAAEILAPQEASLAGYAGLLMQPFRARYYYEGGIAPHVVGYVGVIQENEVEQYKRLGYNVWSDRVGKDGLEYWGESYLAGKRGGVLYLVDPAGNILTKLAESDTLPAQAVYTTLDKDLQLGLQETRALSDGLKGAIVVLERDTGRVLAMLSSPSFDPNLFEPTNYNSGWLLQDVFNPETTPWLNRAVQGQYPLGSVFKIMTIAAALESGLYTTESEYNCGYFFEELDGYRPNDWTYDHFLEDGRTQASGILTLPEGLMRSCNPWFWHIGLDFFDRGMVKSISDMARAFGLGAQTGIELTDEPGQIPDPVSKVDAINLAIGQGNTLVTPLQVAAFIAAVGNGGTLYEPHVVERIVPPDGEPTFVFTPTIQASLPITPTNLQVIQDAMLSVIRNPRGTAYFVLNSFSNSNNIPIAGKTGTAESGTGDPHAWFAGYTFAGRETRPDIAVVVLVENGGEGSEVAAPIFRRVMEIYFGLNPIKYPWEAQVGLMATPTPEVTDTPTPEASETPEVTETPTP